VAVKTTYVYAAAARSGLRVISVADPAHPVEVGYLDTPGRAWSVEVVGDIAYVADGDSGLRVISVTDPAHPAEVGHCDTPGGAQDVVVDGEYAYVADVDSGLRAISVADPTHPAEVGHCATPSWAMGVAVSGDHVYVADNWRGLRVISVADPAHPVEVGHLDTPGRARDVAVVGSLAYVADFDSGQLHVVSITEPAHPVEVGRCDSVRLALAVTLTRNYALVASSYSALQVVLVADSAHPVEVGYYRIGQSYCVAVNRSYAYVGGPTGLTVLQFYQRGDLDVDNDSLDVVSDTMMLHRPGSTGIALGEFLLANTSAAYNPDSIDGPSVSPVDSLRFSGSLSGPGGTLDSIAIPNLPNYLTQGQVITCTLKVYVPPGMPGDYAGAITITGKDTAGLLVDETFYAFVQNRYGDLDIDNDSLDVRGDTIRVLPRVLSSRPPPVFTEYALGEFTLANTSTSYNPDTADGPSLSPVGSLRFTGSLVGPGGSIDSVFIANLPTSLAQGQTATCTLTVYVPVGLPCGDYSGPIVISGYDSFHFEVAETAYALVTKLGDLDVDNNLLGVVHDTINLYTQPAGPVYSPYAKAEFMLVNTSRSYNPDAEDGPSGSPLYIVGYDAYLRSAQDTIDSIYLRNLPSRLELGQAVTCTFALVLPVGTLLDDYSGLVTIDAYDSVGCRVRDSFFLTVRGPQPRGNLDSLRVAPIPFKPNQNPEHDAIHFQGLSAGARVTVYDASGQSVWSATEHGDGHLEWDARVASGIYVYLVLAKDGDSRVGKLSVIR
jgi:hypothetical protein